MSREEKEQLEKNKIEAEIRKLESDISLTHGAKIRGWITTVSVSVGIVVTVFQVYQTLSDISLKNRQLAMESGIRSHQVFLNDVLDRMSGIKSVRNKVDKDGVLKLDSNETYGDTTQVGSYGAATALACDFQNLRLPAEAALTYQVAKYPKDKGAMTMLKRLKEKCPPGWDTIADDEKVFWNEGFNMNSTDSAKP